MFEPVQGEGGQGGCGRQGQGRQGRAQGPAQGRAQGAGQGAGLRRVSFPHSLGEKVGSRCVRLRPPLGKGHTNGQAGGGSGGSRPGGPNPRIERYHRIARHGLEEKRWAGDALSQGPAVLSESGAGPNRAAAHAGAGGGSREGPAAKTAGAERGCPYGEEALTEPARYLHHARDRDARCTGAAGERPGCHPAAGGS